MKTCLKCNCGQTILRRDVMRQGYYVRQFGPSFVYIRYRCSRCKKLGEHYVKQEDWEEGLLSETFGEVSPPEKSQFAKLGAITFEEMKHFHQALEKMERVPLPVVKEEQG